jgi:hypothetical protein
MTVSKHVAAGLQTGLGWVLAVAALATSVHAQQPQRPAETPRGVTLTLAEYNRLIDLSSRAPQPPAPPLPAVLASATLNLRVDGDAARGTFNVTGESFRNGVDRVRLLSGSTLISATTPGRAVPLMTDGASQLALVPGPGAFTLDLEWGAPLVFRPGRASFALPVPESGTARASIDLPGEQADVHLSTGLITRRTVANGRTTVEATLVPGKTTEVWWSMRDSAPTVTARELRALADVWTLITIGDSDVRMAALVDVTVVQGELRTLGVRLPSGYELTGVTGTSLESSEPRDGGLVITVGDPAARRHQFLVSLERSHEGGSFALDTGLVSVRDVQRERGEIAVEGVGTLDLSARERDGMHRIDVKELDRTLQSLGRLPTLAAFRYQSTAATAPGLALDVKRFADAGVLAAVAERVTATTLVTGEGRALTEVKLTIQNRAQPFLKVTLPAGATMASVEVAGEPAKPALGADGTRVPLLRPGFRPNGPYEVSFVYLHAGTPFAKKGELDMALPKMDIPVGVVAWEVFVPDRYSTRAIGGNALDLGTLAPELRASSGARLFDVAVPVGATGGRTEFKGVAAISGEYGELRGLVRDASGAVLPGVTVEAASISLVGRVRAAVTDNNGVYRITGLPGGQYSLTFTLPGFAIAKHEGITVNGAQAATVNAGLSVGSVTETVTVTGASPPEPVPPPALLTFDQTRSLDRDDRPRARAEDPKFVAPSNNVVSLQRRTAGVLPIRLDVPRAGTSLQFVKPLVVDQEVNVTLRYKRRG